MDKTKTYIKMSDCEEIQKQMPELWHSPCCLEKDFSKWSSAPSQPIYVITKEEYVYITEESGLSRQVWLPRQDELQAMVKDNYKDVGDLAYFFWAWIAKYAVMEIDKFTLMKQLWLAFVMWTLYHKKWHNDKWEKV